MRTKISNTSTPAGYWLNLPSGEICQARNWDGSGGLNLYWLQLMCERGYSLTNIVQHHDFPGIALVVFKPPATT